MNVPEDRRYTKDHEWAKDRGDGTALVGITDYAQDALGDITYLELPKVGSELKAGGACGVIESVKTFSDIYAPLSGSVVEVNESLNGNEAAVNQSPYEEGWMFAVRVGDAGEWESLLTADAYRDLLEREEA